MSLTQVLKTQEIKEAFAAAFKRPDFQKTVPPLVAASRAKDSSLVGIAFDYLFRSELGDTQIVRSGARPEQESEEGVSNLSQSDASTVGKLKRSLRVIEFLPIARAGLELLCQSDDVSIKIKKQAKHAWEHAQGAEMRKQMATGENLTLTERAHICLQMAKLDQVYRARYVHEDFETVDPDDVSDLMTMFEQVKFNIFKAHEVCLLNPPLKAAGLVGGADADIVLDDLLIDLKTTTSFSLTINQLNKLYGYLVLSRLGGFAGVKSSPEIRRLGIYFARYDYLFTFNVEDVISSDALKAFCKWFKKTLSASQVDALIRPVTRKKTIEWRF